MVDKKDIIDTITLLKMTYPNSLKDYGENELKMMIEIWFNDFKDTSKEDFKKAINDIRYTSSFFPSIADIKKRIAESKTSDIPSAEDEWQEVLNAVRHYGSYKETEALKSLNPYTSKITQLIGYYRICTSNQEQQTWNKKEFIDEYNSLKDEYITDLQIGTKGVNLLNE